MESIVNNGSNKENIVSIQRIIHELDTLKCRSTLLVKQRNEGIITEEEYNEQFEVFRPDLALYEESRKQWIQQAEERFAAIEAISIYNYFKDGKSLPRMTINRSMDYNNYTPITNKIERPFGTITNIDPVKLHNCKLSTSRLFDPDRLNCWSIDVYEYCHFVLCDILTAAKLNQFIFISRQLEHTIDTCQYSNTFTIILNGVKAGVALPRSKANIDQNMGELYDYMMRLRSYDGVTDCFGILTSFDQWYICWLPDTDDYATSTATEYDSLPAPSPVVPRIMTSSLERTLHYSTYSTGPTDEVKPLSYALYTLFNKIASSSRLASLEPVLLLNPQRSYIHMTSSGWLWVPRSTIKADQLTLAPPPINTASFILI